MKEGTAPQKHLGMARVVEGFHAFIHEWWDDRVDNRVDSRSWVRIPVTALPVFSEVGDRFFRVNYLGM